MIIWGKKQTEQQGLPEDRYAVFCSSEELGVILGCIEAIYENRLLRNNPSYEMLVMKVLSDMEKELAEAEVLDAIQF